MIGESVLALALLFAAPPQPESTPKDASHGPPAISLEELNAFVQAGNYHRIRIEKLGRSLEATGKVETVAANGDWLIVELPGFLRAALRGLPQDHALVAGDRVRFRGMIVDEGYACLQVWSYDFEELPPLAAGAQAPEKTAALSKAASPPGAERHAPSLASQAKSSEEILPKVTHVGLEATLKAGDYTRVRREMIGHRLFADAVVESVGAWPLVRLSENWQAHLRSHSDEMDLKEGDRVRLQGLIVAEAYAAVTVWVERIEKLPAEAAPAK